MTAAGGAGSAGFFDGEVAFELAVRVATFLWAFSTFLVGFFR
jgi:hypothetical protein